MSDSFALPVILASVVLAGCSSAAYDEAYAKRVAMYLEAARFSALQNDPIRIDDPPVTLRIPRDWSQSTASGSVPEWLPQTLQFRRLAEAGIATGEETYPATLFVATSDRSPADIERDFEAIVGLGQSTQQTLMQWSSPDADSIVGGPVVWRVASFTRDERATVLGQAGPRPVNLKMSCHTWVSADVGQERCLVLVWMVPSDATIGLDPPPLELTRLVARTVVGSRGDTDAQSSSAETQETEQPGF